LFVLDRVNTEVFVFCLLAFFYLDLDRGRDRQAGYWLGAAIAMKIVPVVFLPLLMKRKGGWRNGIGAVLVAAVLTVAGVTLFDGSISSNLQLLLAHLSKYEGAYVHAASGLQHNSSLWGAWRELGFSAEWILASAPYYRILAAGSYLVIAAIILLFETALWESALAMTLAFCALPFVSFDYKLIHLILPLGLMFKSRLPVEPSLVVGAALLLIAKDYWILHDDASINGVMNAGILVTLTGVLAFKITRRPMRYG
ncbi:MAG: glycosyltransferase 87 family protein, partial [Bdellovibrionota bacterium]